MDENVDSRTTILACALQLFAWRGYDAVGVQEIVDMAGITKPTLYHYFGSKRGLLDTLLSSESGAFFDDLDRAALYDGNLPLTLSRIVATYFDFAGSHRLFYRLALAAWFGPPDSELADALSPALRRQQERLDALFARAAGDYAGLRGRERAVATAFLAMINTHIGLALNSHTLLDEEIVHSTVHDFLHGILSE